MCAYLLLRRRRRASRENTIPAGSGTDETGVLDGEIPAEERRPIVADFPVEQQQQQQ